MSDKILSLQKLSTKKSDNPDKKSVLSIFICEGGKGSSVSLYACTSIVGS
ncbi:MULTISPECIES: class III lanthipeptide [Bacillus]|nr:MULTISPECIES: class III lanthipeptide [Bacillus]MCA6609078.1 class III lanthipeptide [Bacillus safensis]MCP8952810.1 class III lanthipeptide [Bacillus safensis]WCL57090.1 class III lanthipeptide [Bacillus safensis]